MAEPITAEQARELGDRFLTLATELSNYCLESNNLTDSERTEIQAQTLVLLRHASDLTAVAISTTLEDLENSLAHTAQVTEQMRQAIVQLNRPKQAIRIAAAAITLAAAVLTFNPVAIAGAIQSARQAVNQ